MFLSSRSVTPPNVESWSNLILEGGRKGIFQGKLEHGYGIDSRRNVEPMGMIQKEIAFYYVSFRYNEKTFLMDEQGWESEEDLHVKRLNSNPVIFLILHPLYR